MDVISRTSPVSFQHGRAVAAAQGEGDPCSSTSLVRESVVVHQNEAYESHNPAADVATFYSNPAYGKIQASQADETVVINSTPRNSDSDEPVRQSEGAGDTFAYELIANVNPAYGIRNPVRPTSVTMEQTCSRAGEVLPTTSAQGLLAPMVQHGSAVAATQGARDPRNSTSLVRELVVLHQNEAYGMHSHTVDIATYYSNPAYEKTQTSQADGTAHTNSTPQNSDSDEHTEPLLQNEAPERECTGDTLAYKLTQIAAKVNQAYGAIDSEHGTRNPNVSVTIEQTRSRAVEVPPTTSTQGPIDPIVHRQHNNNMQSKAHGSKINIKFQGWHEVTVATAAVLSLLISGAVILMCIIFHGMPRILSDPAQDHSCNCAPSKLTVLMKTRSEVPLFHKANFLH